MIMCFQGLACVWTMWWLSVEVPGREYLLGGMTGLRTPALVKINR